ncbi:MAG: hypothetical protein CVU99_15645 [Firmicutes bacterium HGW-Firmicutes-4]|nr:MAG: hypothetical protein CVU99_15645 [Firmicutes bacterium HGW-Firmicutes-4]
MIKVNLNQNKNKIYFYLIVYFLFKRCYIDVNNSHFHNNFQERPQAMLEVFPFFGCVWYADKNQKIES